MLSHEFKKAATDDIKTEIQCRLEEAERGIRGWKEKVIKCEHQVTEYKGELKKEGELTVFQSLT